MRVVFDGGLLEHVGAKPTAKVLVMLLRALVECNLDYLAAHPNTPHPYRAGIRYRREQKTERWKSIPKILRDGHGDCEDLAAYLAAYWVHHGKRPVSVVVKSKRIGRGRLYHVLTRGPRGLEDPSRRLGM